MGYEIKGNIFPPCYGHLFLLVEYWDKETLFS